MLYYIYYIFHLVGAVLWIGGLMIVTWMANYHLKLVTRGGKPEHHAVLSAIEKRLFWVTATPGLLVTWTLGLANAISYRPDLWRVGWFHGKLTFALLMVAVHVVAYLKLSAFHKEEKPAEYKPIFIMLHGIAGLLLIVIVMFVSWISPGT